MHLVVAQSIHLPLIPSTQSINTNRVTVFDLFFIPFHSYTPTVNDASKAVEEQVRAKIMEKKLPPKLKERLLNKVGKIAGDLVPASKIAEKMAPKMVEEMPEKMKPKGLTVHVEEVFREGPFFVLELQLLEVDTVKLMEGEKDEADDTKAREEPQQESMTTGLMRRFLGVLGDSNKASLEREYLPKVVQAKMQGSMGDMLKAQLAEKNLEADTEVLDQTEQARYFFNMIQQVRAAEAESPKGLPLPPFLKKKDSSSK